MKTNQYMVIYKSELQHVAIIPAKYDNLGQLALPLHIPAGYTIVLVTANLSHAKTTARRYLRKRAQQVKLDHAKNFGALKTNISEIERLKARHFI